MISQYPDTLPAMKHQGPPLDVIIDLTLNPSGRDVFLIEALLAADEGMQCHYRVRLGRRRPSPELQSSLLELVSRKGAQVIDKQPNIEFPTDLLDAELEAANTEEDRRRAIAKRAWFDVNLGVLDAIEGCDEFVYLPAFSVPLVHGWLAALTTAGRGRQVPVLGFSRKLLVGRAYCACGWSTMGWYDGRRLRKLPLRRAFTARLDNPWRLVGNFAGQPDGPGFCLAGKWLSGFDVPMDYLLFAVYWLTSVGGNDPLMWARADDLESLAAVGTDTPDDSSERSKWSECSDTVLEQRSSYAANLQDALLRDLWQNAAKSVHSATCQLGGDDADCFPIGGPRRNMLGHNRIRFAIDTLRDLFLGERCFIIGNGPSLNKTDLSLLRYEYTIGLNRIYLNYPKMGYQPSFLCVTNPNVIEQFHAEIDVLGSIKFLTYQTQDLIKNRWNTFLMETAGAHDFFEDLRELTWCEGCTVTYCAIQLAFYLGFETVVLVGVDHGFPVSGAPNRLVTATGPDQNHFHPNYFGAGVKWQYPDLPGSEVSYRVAKAVFESHGRRILDATIGGKLEVFPKVDYADYLASSTW